MQQKLNGSLIFCWFSAAVLVICLVSALVVGSGLDTLSQTSSEVSSVASRLDSVSGLRGLLISFSNQCEIAQQSWSKGVTVSMGLVFLSCLIGFALIATLAVQLSLNRKQASQLQKLHKLYKSQAR
jgi:TRAP-type C4-dicarboxylate transport system permease small subunit